MCFWTSHTTGRLPMAAFAFFACATLTAWANGGAYTLPPFNHYQPILDRMPFGSLPANFDAAPVDQEALKTAEQEKADQQALAKQVSMSAVNVTPSGATAIGFVDSSVNPPVSYYLRVGERSDGWLVKSADFDSECATLEKEGVEITLKLGEGLVDAPPEPVKQKQTAEMLANAIKRDPAADEAAKKADEAAAQSFAERLRERAAQKTQAEHEAENRMREQFEKLARETAVREIKRRQEEEALAEEERAFLEQQAQPR